MLFTLKKIIGGLVMPLPFILLIMAVALILLWCTRWQKTGKTFFLLSWLILGLISLQPIADRLLSPLVNTYPTYQNQQEIKYIVVLGGGYTFNPQLAPSSNLSGFGLQRIAEGVRIYQQNPGTKLIFTGAPTVKNTLSSAGTAAKVAESLGVPRHDIITLDTPRDTQQEAQQVASSIGNQPFALVTSADHLPRAMIFFQQQGLSPLPAPSGQVSTDSPLGMREKLLPQSKYLSRSERAWYEILGRLLQRMN